MGPWYYEQQVLGLNYRLTDVAASLGLSQLKKLKKFIKIRNKLAKLYNKNLNIKYVKIPFIDKNTFSSFHLYVIKINNKYKKFHQNLFYYLRDKGINVNLHYVPLHLHPFYRKLGFKRGDFKNSEDHAERAISLPIFPELKKRCYYGLQNN